MSEIAIASLSAMKTKSILYAIMSLLLSTFWAESAAKNPYYYFRTLDIKDGLSHNTVNTILQDRQGFMWFGTKDGLNQYDGLVFRTFQKENSSLGNNFITALHEDAEGNIWVGTDTGVYIYNPRLEKFTPFDIPIEGTGETISRTITWIDSDPQKDVWISSDSQGLFHYDIKKNSLKEYSAKIGKGALNITRFWFGDNELWVNRYEDNLYHSEDAARFTVFRDAEGEEPFKGAIITTCVKGLHNCIYIGSSNGLAEINLTTRKVRRLLNDYVRNICLRSDTELWVGTEQGIYIYNLETDKYIHLTTSESDDRYALSDNAIYTIFKDREGGMWIGTYFGGVNYYPRQYTYFDKVYPQKESNKMGKRVREFCAAHDGTLWIGTEDKGLFHYYPSTGKIEPFIHPDIYHNVHGLYLDGDYLWVGNFAKGLKRIDLRTYAVKHYDNIASDIFSICRITAGDLYLGTTIGLFRYNPDTERFKRVPELGWTFVYYIKEDKQGNLWLATYADGVYKKNVRTGGWEHFVHEEADSSTLPSNKVLSIFEDSQNQLWFTTQGGGFCRFVPSANTFVRYDGIGLPSNVIYRIEEDEKGLFWVSTNKGLVHFNPKNSSFKVYTVANGLLSNQFNYQSSYKDKNGRIYFGCINGFISFAPSSFIDNDFLPSVLITDFMLFNKKVVVGEKGSPLKQSITLSNHIELQSNQNSFSFRIAAISYQSPSMNTLLYRLEGYDSEWHTAGKGPITYSNLPYGTYMLRVKGANSDGVWNPDVRTLGIRILPPFYLSVWAYLIYILLILGTFFALFFYLRKRTIEKQRKEMEKFEQEKEQELYTTKIDFFTNVAHEIRTPLTLIKCPLENVLADRELSENVRMELEIMDQNVERLLNLINQLLDFRKAENKGFKLNPKEYNIGTIVHSVYKYFTTLAKQRGIKLEVEVPEEELLASVDKEALTKILSNLFANALKYARTYVYLHLSVDEKNEVFTISMSNDGNIVPIEMRENIFKAFVQYRDGKDIVSGTGIGLAMARYLAELHQGMLVMDRELDCNRFILSIPILHQTLPDDSEEQHKKPGYDDEDREVSDKDKREVASILVVEDNKDMLAFVFRQLSSLYHVLIAENGVEALDVLEQKSVDLIISDIMMPLMDGVELCKHLKQNLDYSHIPVILLTAKTNLESRIEGLEEGADAYIEKPFSMEYLRANVANLLSNRERLRRHFIEFPFIKADAMAQTKADEMFISKLNEYVLRHLDNTDLQIDDIADAMNMGRSNFYRKLKGILNMSPNEYLRLFRLKQAASILKEGTYGVVEVSYMVGFSTPSYFSSCFKKQFGVLPKDFISH